MTREVEFTEGFWWGWVLGIFLSCTIFLVVIPVSFYKCTTYKVVSDIKSVNGSYTTVLFEDGTQKRVSNENIEIGERICVARGWVLPGLNNGEEN